jgi:hypothetical protein
MTGRRYVLVLGSLLVVAVGLGFCFSVLLRRGESVALPLPLVQFIARPDDFSGHVLSLQGYLVTHGTRGELFQSEADASHGLVSNGVAIDFAAARVPADLMEHLNRRFVTVIGRADSETPVAGAAGLITPGSLPLLRDIEAIQPIMPLESSGGSQTGAEQ